MAAADFDRLGMVLLHSACREIGGKNNVLLKLYHVLLLLFWLFCGTELFVHEKIEKFYLAREIRKSFFLNCMRNGNNLILPE